MQQFNTDDAAHKFEINGQAYSLPAITPDDFDDVGAVLTVAPDARFQASRDFIYSRADEDALAAIRKLSIKQLSELFRAWLGLDSGDEGKSQGSAE